MLKYAKIIDDKTKLCVVGIGTDIKEFQSMGLVEMEVEQAYNNCWYIKGYAPEKPKEIKEEEVKQVRNSMLEDIEWRVARAREQRELGIKTVDNYYNLIHYKQYLRDYPDITENWWEQNPLEFEEWEKQYEYRQES